MEVDKNVLNQMNTWTKLKLKACWDGIQKMNKSGNVENILERLNQDLSASNENSDDVETFNLYEEVSI